LLKQSITSFRSYFSVAEFHFGRPCRDIKDNNFQLNIQWIKQINGKHGGDWTTRIHVTPQE